jgi:hypothetical protein
MLLGGAAALAFMMLLLADAGADGAIAVRAVAAVAIGWATVQPFGRDLDPMPRARRILLAAGGIGLGAAVAFLGARLLRDTPVATALMRLADRVEGLGAPLLALGAASFLALALGVVAGWIPGRWLRARIAGG